MHLYSEHNAYRAAVLRERIAEGLLPQGVVDERDIEIVPDEDFLGYTQIHLFAGIGGFPLGMRLAGFPEDRRIVDGGFPCQDISNAGKRAGITGTRSRLWREMVRCIRVVRPEFVFVENVAALLGRGMGVVLGDLAEIGYDAIGDCISAAEVGAPHLRRRIWIVAHAIGDGVWDQSITERWSGSAAESEHVGEISNDSSERTRQLPARSRRLHETALDFDGDGEIVANSNGGRCESGDAEERSIPVVDSRSATLSDADTGTMGWPAESRRQRCEWLPEPNVGRVAHGIPKRVDRLAALGDAIVPQCVAKIIQKFNP
jgi:DNA (cytosine-5)-methyltransferase 1